MKTQQKIKAAPHGLDAGGVDRIEDDHRVRRGPQARGGVNPVARPAGRPKLRVDGVGVVPALAAAPQRTRH